MDDYLDDELIMFYAGWIMAGGPGVEFCLSYQYNAEFHFANDCLVELGLPPWYI